MDPLGILGYSGGISTRDAVGRRALAELEKPNALPEDMTTYILKRSRRPGEGNTT